MLLVDDDDGSGGGGGGNDDDDDDDDDDGASNAKTSFHDLHADYWRRFNSGRWFQSWI